MSSSLANRWRAVGLASMAVLVALTLTLQLSAGLTISSALVSLVLCVPILATFVGVWRKHRYTYRWATLCVAPYLIVGLVEAIANPSARGWAAAMLAAATVWFVSLVAFLRITARN